MTDESNFPANDKPAAESASENIAQDLEARVTAADAESVKGGTTNRVKTSDKQQKAVLDFVKG
jgi:hypothetical protein